MSVMTFSLFVPPGWRTLKFTLSYSNICCQRSIYKYGRSEVPNYPHFYHLIFGHFYVVVFFIFVVFAFEDILDQATFIHILQIEFKILNLH